MNGCQNYGPFLDPYYDTAPCIKGTQKGAIILTATHIGSLKGTLECSVGVCSGLLFFELLRG